MNDLTQRELLRVLSRMSDTLENMSIELKNYNFEYLDMQKRMVELMEAQREEMKNEDFNN